VNGRDARPNPLLTGLKCRCPNCGRGPLFKGFLKVRERCEACGFDLRAADSGDGPAVFIILIVGFLTAFGALFTEVAYKPPAWLQLVIWLPLATVLCLVLLRPFKGVLIALQFHNKASQARSDDF
jgi:uncharacterized protein (DUF983 family)